MSWPMHDPPDAGVFVTRFLWGEREPLLGVRHHDDGDWTLWGCTEPSDENADDILILVHLQHVLERFPEVGELAELSRGRAAVRSSPEAPFVEIR
jgi:hypothetical protein